MKVFWWQLGLHFEPGTPEENKALCLLFDNANLSHYPLTSRRECRVSHEHDCVAIAISTPGGLRRRDQRELLNTDR